MPIFCLLYHEKGFLAREETDILRLWCRQSRQIWDDLIRQPVRAATFPKGEGRPSPLGRVAVALRAANQNKMIAGGNHTLDYAKRGRVRFGTPPRPTGYVRVWAFADCTITYFLPLGFLQSLQDGCAILKPHLTTERFSRYDKTKEGLLCRI